MSRRATKIGPRIAPLHEARDATGEIQIAWKLARTGRFAVSIGLVLASGAAAHATSVTEVTSRAALGANDLLDWGVLHGDPQQLPNPVTGFSAGGLAVTLSTTADRFINTYGTTHNSITDFAPTDSIIGTQQFSPIKLGFATPVFGAGLLGLAAVRRRSRRPR